MFPDASSVLWSSSIFIFSILKRLESVLCVSSACGFVSSTDRTRPRTLFFYHTHTQHRHAVHNIWEKLKEEKHVLPGFILLLYSFAPLFDVLVVFPLSFFFQGVCCTIRFSHDVCFLFCQSEPPHFSSFLTSKKVNSHPFFPRFNYFFVFLSNVVKRSFNYLIKKETFWIENE